MANQKTSTTTSQDPSVDKVTPDQKVFQYIQEWQKGKAFVDRVIVDFKRLDTIANAQYEGANNKNPNVGDTTVAGIVRQMMRSAVKTLPQVTVAINGSQNTVEAIICRNRIQKVLLNPITFGKGFVNLLQLGGRGAISRGFTCFEVVATKRYGQFGVVPKQIHFNDIAIEPGTLDGNHSPYFYSRIKMTPLKLQSIYKREKAKPVGQSTYNIKALEALIAMGPDSSGSSDYAEYVTPMEVSKIEANAETYDLIVRRYFDTSVPTETFSPSINQIIRTVPNRSKFGFPRVLFLVIDPAELSPFGDSRVRLASPNQNFLMALRQNVATTWLYNSKPTMVKTGLFTGATNLKSGGVITSTDPNAKVQLLTLDTATSQQYPTISQEITKQIQNMMGVNPDQGLGSLGESKTGVGAQKQAQGIDDSTQQITNIAEEFVCQYLLSGLDLYLSEQDGEGVIYVDDKTKQDILKVAPTDSNGDPTFSDPTNPNALRVNWNQLYEYIQEIDITVDTTMSKDDWEDKERGDLQDALTVMTQTANPNDPEAQARIKAVEDEFLEETVPEVASELNNAPPAATPTPADPASNLTAMPQ